MTEQSLLIVLPSAGAVWSSATEAAPTLGAVLDALRADAITSESGQAVRWRLVGLALRAGASWSLISDVTGLPAMELCDGFRRYLRALDMWLDCWPGRAFDGFSHDEVIELYRLAREAGR